MILKFQGLGVLGERGQPAVCPVAPGSRPEGESVTPRCHAMVGRLAWGTRHTHAPAAPSLALWMATGRRGNPGVNAGLLSHHEEPKWKIYISQTYLSQISISRTYSSCAVKVCVWIAVEQSQGCPGALLLLNLSGFHSFVITLLNIAAVSLRCSVQKQTCHS